MSDDMTGDTTDADKPGSHRRSDRKWPWPARLGVTVLLLPVLAAAILAAEDDFGFIGQWFDPLMILFMTLITLTVWITTSRSQR